MKRTVGKTTGLIVLALLLALIMSLAGCATKDAESTDTGTEPAVTEPAEDAGPTVVDFSKEVEGPDVVSFVPMVGNWKISKDADNLVLEVDGTGWTKGTVRPDLADQVTKALGDGSEAFYTNVSTYSDYPFALENSVQDFTEGEISMRFKTLSGEEDQGAGILFDVKPNGDYLTIRANPLENNIVMFEMVAGKRTKLVEIKDIATKKGEWSKISVTIEGTTAKAFLDGVQVMETPLKAPVSGRIGIWTKADSHVLYDDYTVTAK